MTPDTDGITLLRSALEHQPELVGILMTGQGTVQTAVEAMKIGAFDYLLKPLKLGPLLPILTRALEVRRLRAENLQFRATLVIYELAQAVTYSLDLDAILAKVADAALQQTGADEASILLPGPADDELHVALVRGPGRDRLLGERVPPARGIAGWTARHREPLLLQDAVNDPRFAPDWPRPDLRSAIVVPLLAGVLNVGASSTAPATRRTRRSARSTSTTWSPTGWSSST